MKYIALFAMTFFLFSTSLSAQTAMTVAATSTIEEGIQWNNTTQNLGDVAQNKPAKATFVLTNTGNTPLVLKNVKPSCGCTAADYTKEPIAPGASTQISATYNAKSPGKFSKIVRVYTDQSDAPVLLTIKGNVIKG